MRRSLGAVLRDRPNRHMFWCCLTLPFLLLTTGLSGGGNAAHAHGRDLSYERTALAAHWQIAIDNPSQDVTTAPIQGGAARFTLPITNNLALFYAVDASRAGAVVGTRSTLWKYGYFGPKQHLTLDLAFSGADQYASVDLNPCDSNAVLADELEMGISLVEVYVVAQSLQTGGTVPAIDVDPAAVLNAAPDIFAAAAELMSVNDYTAPFAALYKYANATSLPDIVWASADLTTSLGKVLAKPWALARLAPLIAKGISVAGHVAVTTSAVQAAMKQLGAIADAYSLAKLALRITAMFYDFAKMAVERAQAQLSGTIAPIVRIRLSTTSGTSFQATVSLNNYETRIGENVGYCTNVTSPAWLQVRLVVVGEASRVLVNQKASGQQCRTVRLTGPSGLAKLMLDAYSLAGGRFGSDETTFYIDVAATPTTVPTRVPPPPPLPTPVGPMTVQRIIAALLAGRSFELTIDASGSTWAGSVSMHLHYVVVGAAPNGAFYLTGTVPINMLGSTSVETIDAAGRGDRGCLRVNGGAWSCGRIDTVSWMGGTINLGQLLPQVALNSGSVSGPLTPIGASTIGGQRVQGYEFSTTNGSGTFWVDPATSRLVEETASTTDSSSGAKATVDGVVTHWNDPALKLPYVPGL